MDKDVVYVYNVIFAHEKERHLVICDNIDGPPVLWPPHAKSWLIGKDPDAGKDWGQKEKGTTEDEMVGWHHRLDAHEFEEAPGVGDGQGSLACCSSWGRKELDMTEWLNWTEHPCISFLLIILQCSLHSIYWVTGVVDKETCCYKGRKKFWIGNKNYLG